ncbi:hypothetical protein FGO68_gene5032 [Halteria grandinella]|uniref:Uncharacterized protein n=1 Tax=Halteria grandinella TaxID=5974 RepID=A0A8J8P727_HALGN|nr:hypothetical protein FGO68_gene5032 [Halteria grandinella]
MGDNALTYQISIPIFQRYSSLVNDSGGIENCYSIDNFSSHCKLCGPGYFLQQNSSQCTRQCEQGTFPQVLLDPLNQEVLSATCENCSPQCSTCNSEEGCTQCASGYQLENDGRCTQRAESSSSRTYALRVTGNRNGSAENEFGDILSAMSKVYDLEHENRDNMESIIVLLRVGVDHFILESDFIDNYPSPNVSLVLLINCLAKITSSKLLAKNHVRVKKVYLIEIGLRDASSLRIHHNALYRLNYLIRLGQNLEYQLQRNFQFQMQPSTPLIQYLMVREAHINQTQQGKVIRPNNVLKRRDNAAKLTIRALVFNVVIQQVYL